MFDRRSIPALSEPAVHAIDVDVDARRSSLQLPDGRSLEVWQAGTPGTGLPFEHHLLAEHGHLTLVVDSFGQILDELLTSGD